MNVAREDDSGIRPERNPRTEVALAAWSLVMAAIIIAIGYYALVISFHLEASVDPGSISVPKGKNAVFNVHSFLNGKPIDATKVQSR